MPRAVVGVEMLGVAGRDDEPPSFRIVGVDGRDDKTSSGRNFALVGKSLDRGRTDLERTFGGSGLFSLAALIALMLFAAESSSGALASHSSTLIVSFAGVGGSVCV